MRPLIFFTIVANNYLGYAKTLMDSVREYHPSSRRVVVLCDKPVVKDWIEEIAEILPATQLKIPEFAAMAFAYDVMELSTAIKPSSFLYFNSLYPDADIVYLDPDILVKAPLIHILAELAEGASVVLTPHLTAPLQDGLMPDDLTIMKSGIYNLGFIAIRPNSESIALVEWWRDRCRRDAVVDIAENKFTDQRWMDMAPAFVRHTHILHNHAYNVAYWNLAHRHISRNGTQTLVDGEPLRFVHFSGVNPGDTTIFSKHQNRFIPENLGAFRPLFEEYITLVLSNGWNEYRSIPCIYDRFIGGRRIHPMMRASFRRHEKDVDFDPFAENGKFFDSPEPNLASFGPPSITCVMYELWHRRGDLRSTFNLEGSDGRLGYLKWFVEMGAIEAQFDEASREAAEDLKDGAENIARFAPWQPQLLTHFDGPSANATAWLSTPVPLNVITDTAGIPIPRHLALVWEQRSDLSRHFSNRNTADLRNFLYWCLTIGTEEGSIDLTLIESAIAPYLDSSVGEWKSDALPATRIMHLAKPHYNGVFPHVLSGFPENLEARMALALWLRGPVAKKYDWPASFVQRLDAWGKQRAAGFSTISLPIDNWLHALWLLRADVRAAFPLDTHGGQMRFLSWVVNYGMREAALPLSALSDETRMFIAAPMGRKVTDPIRRLHYLVLSGQPDLASRYDPERPEDQNALCNHVETDDVDPWSGRSWLDWATPNLKASHVSKVKKRPTTVLVTGLIDEPSGRGEDTRMTAAALKSAGVPFAILDRASGRFLTSEGSEWYHGVESFTVNIVHLNADTAINDYLFLRRHGLRNCYTVGYWAWELAVFPDRWNNAFSFYDEIWASTEFAYHSFRKKAFRPVHLMPMAVQIPSTKASLGREYFELPTDRFIFFFGFDFRSHTARKNPYAALEAFHRAFPKGNEKTALVIKTMGGGEHKAQLNALRKAASHDPRILIRDHKYSFEELATLIQLCDCYVSLHRSEGFGRGPAEAMALGKPVIATGYSGNLNFMTEKNSLLVNYKLVPVGKGEYPGWEGQTWADPDINHAAELMKKIQTFPDDGLKLGKQAKISMSTHYNFNKIGKQYLERLNEIRILRQKMKVSANATLFGDNHAKS